MAELSPKRRAFVEAYLQCWNASEAARRAGYSEHTADRQGSRLLTFVEVKAEIERRLADMAMSADEVLHRLAEQARAEYSVYIRNDGTVNLAEMIAAGKAHLIKGTKWDTRGNLVVEFHDAHAALVDIGKHHGLFTDRMEVTGKDGAAMTIRYVNDWRHGDEA